MPTVVRPLQLDRSTAAGSTRGSDGEEEKKEEGSLDLVGRATREEKHLVIAIVTSMRSYLSTAFAVERLRDKSGPLIYL